MMPPAQLGRVPCKVHGGSHLSGARRGSPRAQTAMPLRGTCGMPPAAAPMQSTGRPAAAGRPGRAAALHRCDRIVRGRPAAAGRPGRAAAAAAAACRALCGRAFFGGGGERTLFLHCPGACRSLRFAVPARLPDRLRRPRPMAAAACMQSLPTAPLPVGPTAPLPVGPTAPLPPMVGPSRLPRDARHIVVLSPRCWNICHIMANF